MKSSRPLAGSVLCLLSLLALSAFSGQPIHAQTPIIKIATQSPLSGRAAALGDGIRNAVLLAVEQLASPLRQLRFQVVVVPFDDQGRPDVGVANARNLVTDPDILLVIGHLHSGVAIPSSEIYKDHDLAMISPANTHPLVTDRCYRNVTRVVGRDDVQGKVAAEFAGRELLARTVYILHDKTAYGQGIASFVRAHTLEHGIEVVGFEGTEEETNFDPVLIPIRARGPDLVYFGGGYAQSGIFFRQARTKGIVAQFMGPDGMDSSELARIAGEAVVGMHYTTVSGPASFFPAAAKFSTDYRQRFGHDPQPFAAQAYDAVAIGLRAIEQAATAAGGRKPTRQAVTEAVRRIQNFKGLTATYSFDDKGDPVPATYFVIRVASSDPRRWGQNSLVRSLQVNPPSCRRKN